jgi:hypothetical protein
MAKPPFDFFRALRGRTETPPNREFDNAFWNRFEKEFGPTQQRQSLASWWRFGLPVGAALALTVLWLASIHPFGASNAPADIFSKPRVVNDMVTYRPILENLEMFEGSGAGGNEDIDFTQLSDKEWAMLLDGKDG